MFSCVVLCELQPSLLVSVHWYAMLIEERNVCCHASPIGGQIFTTIVPAHQKLTTSQQNIKPYKTWHIYI